MRDERIDCDHATVGRYHAAHTKRAWRRLVASAAEANPAFDDGMRPVAREDQHEELFPVLGDVRVSHSWSGTVAYTFDTLAHVGRREGIFHAMGYCDSGVGMAGMPPPSTFGSDLGPDSVPDSG